MSKKHFQALAAALSRAGASLALVHDVAEICAAANPRFNRTKFILACATKAKS